MRTLTGIVRCSSSGADKLDVYPFPYLKNHKTVRVHWPDGSFSVHQVHLLGPVGTAIAHVEVDYRGVKTYVTIRGLFVDYEFDGPGTNPIYTLNGPATSEILELFDCDPGKPPGT